MTGPLVRSIPQTRHRTTGSAIASCRAVTPDAARPTEALPILADRRPGALQSLPTAARHRFSTAATQAANENRGLNAHRSSAVPFNSLFPHS